MAHRFPLVEIISQHIAWLPRTSFNKYNLGTEG